MRNAAGSACPAPVASVWLPASTVAAVRVAWYAAMVSAGFKSDNGSPCAMCADPMPLDTSAPRRCWSARDSNDCANRNCARCASRARVKSTACHVVTPVACRTNAWRAAVIAASEGGKSYRTAGTSNTARPTAHVCRHGTVNPSEGWWDKQHSVSMLPTGCAGSVWQTSGAAGRRNSSALADCVAKPDARCKVCKYSTASRNHAAGIVTTTASPGHGSRRGAPCAAAIGATALGGTSTTVSSWSSATCTAGGSLRNTDTTVPWHDRHAVAATVVAKVGRGGRDGHQSCGPSPSASKKPNTDTGGGDRVPSRGAAASTSSLAAATAALPPTLSMRSLPALSSPAWASMTARRTSCSGAYATRGAGLGMDTSGGGRARAHGAVNAGTSCSVFTRGLTMYNTRRTSCRRANTCCTSCACGDGTTWAGPASPASHGTSARRAAWNNSTSSRVTNLASKLAWGAQGTCTHSPSSKTYTNPWWTGRRLWRAPAGRWK